MQSYFPSQPDEASADLAACHALLRNGSRTFLAASRLLPAEVRDAACALYAFCRLADDCVDGPEGSRHALTTMRERLDGIYRGAPNLVSTDRALARVVLKFKIPRPLFDALLEGFEWDLEGRRFETITDVHAYAARVAGTVGAMMALIMGVTDTEAVARACELGLAMQLSNIARDVGEDARANRLYLPREWLLEAGIDPDRWLREPTFDAALASVVERLLEDARGLYQRARQGIAVLPWRCRSAIQIASTLYSEIGHEVARRGYDSVSSRAVVSSRRKVVRGAYALAGLAFLKKGSGLPVMEATRFLIDPVRAAQASPQPQQATPGTSMSWYQFDRHAEWTLSLFERLGHRDRVTNGTTYRIEASQQVSIERALAR